MTRQPLWVILCPLLEKERIDREETVKEMKKRTGEKGK